MRSARTSSRQWTNVMGSSVSSLVLGQSVKWAARVASSWQWLVRSRVRARSRAAWEDLRMRKPLRWEAVGDPRVERTIWRWPLTESGARNGSHRSRCGDSGCGTVTLMRPVPNRTGVCLIRIEDQGDSALIRVRWNPDVEQVSTERVAGFEDIESAVDTVRGFLAAFVADGGDL
jgi:hypothetical protein